MSAMQQACWDNVTKVVFMGAPSTGKTTLCEALAKEYNTVWMPEFGRDYWLEHQVDRRLTQADLIAIAEGHRQQEMTLVSQANNYFFIDTEAITTRVFAIDYHGESTPELDAYANASAQRYDLFFLCEDDIPFDDTWCRSGETQRDTFQANIRAELDSRGIPYISLTGDLDQRMSEVRKHLTKQP